MHKRLMDPVLAALDSERSAYFSDVAQTLDGDARIAQNGNLVFAFLAAAAPYLPTLAPKSLFMHRLIVFVENHGGRIQRALFDPAYIADHGVMLPVVAEFVQEMTAEVLAMMDEGKLDEHHGHSVYRVGWPFDESAFPYDDPDDPDETD